MKEFRNIDEKDIVNDNSIRSEVRTEDSELVAYSPHLALPCNRFGLG